MLPCGVETGPVWNGVTGLVIVAVLGSPPSALRLNMQMNGYGECNAELIYLLADITGR